MAWAEPATRFGIALHHSEFARIANGHAAQVGANRHHDQELLLAAHNTVFILGVFLFQISEQFESLDIRNLENLKEE